MWVDKGWLLGFWVLGNLYKKANGYYGAFPGNFLKRVEALFPDRPLDRSLHLFSGTLQAKPGEVTVDCQSNDLVCPTTIADCRRLPFPDGRFVWTLADPPYSAPDAAKYNTPMISRRHVMHEARRVTQTGGMLCWLDTVRPMYRADDWRQVGAIGISVSTNTRCRLLSIFEAV